MKKFFVVGLLLLLTAKVAAVLVRGPVSIEMDAWHYWRQSTLVMGGDLLLWQDPIAFRTPMYPWFLAAIRLIAGRWSLMTTIILQGVLLIATVIVLAKIASRITKLPAAFPLTLLCWLPALSAITFSAAVLTESLFVFLLAIHLFAVLDYAKYSTGKHAVWVGVTFALTLLTRPIVILLWPVHLLFLAWIHLRRRKRMGKDAHQTRCAGRMLHLGYAVLAVTLVLSPWCLRNLHLFGKPFITEFVGRNIWIVTFQDGSGAGLDLPKTDSATELTRRLAAVGTSAESDDWRHTWTTSTALVRSGLNDAQADTIMKQVSLEAAIRNQRKFGYKALRRIGNFWRCAAADLPVQDSPLGRYHQQNTWSRVVSPVDVGLRYRFSQSVLGNTILMVILGVASLLLVINLPTRPYGVWLMLILAYFMTVTGVIEIPAYRYRLVVEPIVAAIIGSATAVIFSWRPKPAPRAQPARNQPA